MDEAFFSFGQDGGQARAFAEVCKEKEKNREQAQQGKASKMSFRNWRLRGGAVIASVHGRNKPRESGSLMCVREKER